MHDTTYMAQPAAYSWPRVDRIQMVRRVMKLVTIIFERIPMVWFLLAERLSQPEGDWAPFRSSSWRRLFYPRIG